MNNNFNPGFGNGSEVEKMAASIHSSGTRDGLQRAELMLQALGVTYQVTKESVSSGVFTITRARWAPHWIEVQWIVLGEDGRGVIWFKNFDCSRSCGLTEFANFILAN